MGPHFNLFLGKMEGEFSVPQTKRTIQIFISDRSKSKCLSWYGDVAEQTAWVTGICAKVPLTWRHILGLYRDIYCHQDDVFHGKSMVIISVTNPFHELLFTHHQRSPTHRMDSCTTLHFPSSIALTTHTADYTNHAHT